MNKQKIKYILLMGGILMVLIFLVFPLCQKIGKSGGAEAGKAAGATEEETPGEEHTEGTDTSVPVHDSKGQQQEAQGTDGNEPGGEEVTERISFINRVALTFTEDKETFQKECSAYLRNLGLPEVKMVVVLNNVERLTDRYYYFEFQIDTECAVFNAVYDSENRTYDFALHSGAVTDLEARGGVAAPGDLIARYRDAALEEAAETGAGGDYTNQEGE